MTLYYLFFFSLGMMQAIQNLGLALCNMLTGLIVDQEGYIWLEMFFIFWLAVALVCTIAVWLIDISGDGQGATRVTIAARFATFSIDDLKDNVGMV